MLYHIDDHSQVIEVFGSDVANASSATVSLAQCKEFGENYPTGFVPVMRENKDEVDSEQRQRFRQSSNQPRNHSISLKELLISIVRIQYQAVESVESVYQKGSRGAETWCYARMCQAPLKNPLWQHAVQ